MSSFASLLQCSMCRSAGMLVWNSPIIKHQGNGEEPQNLSRIEETNEAPFLLTESFQVTSLAILNPIAPSAKQILRRASMAYLT